MISQQCQTTYSTIAFFKIFQRLWRYMKHLCQRYGEWHEMKRQYADLLRMDDRMMKDIGLSRFDVTRMMRGHKFWRHMFQPEECENGKRIKPKVEAVLKPEPVQAQPLPISVGAIRAALFSRIESCKPNETCSEDRDPCSAGGHR